MMINAATSNLKAAGIFVVLVLLVAGRGIPAGSAEVADNSAPPGTCASAIQQAYDSMNQTTATGNAQNSSEYSQGTAQIHNPTFNSIFQIEKTTVPYPTCTVRVLSNNVVFTLHNSKGVWAGYLVITEGQNLTVIGSSLQNQTQSATNYSTNWSGYQASSSGTPPTYTVYEAESSFTQPTVSLPSNDCGSANQCNLATWLGLEDELGAGDTHLVQAGTYGFCNYVSGSSCSSTSYEAWYQAGSSSASIICDSSTNGGSVSVSGGDSMYAYVTNEAINNGGSDTKYDFYIDDETSSTSCSMTETYTSMTAPLYGAFIEENEETPQGSYYDPLAKFTGSSFSGADIYENGAFQGINGVVASSLDMHNGNYPTCSTYVDNIDAGTLSNPGDFSTTFNSNDYTPPYPNHCTP
jgi:hypothetical protein